jgi:hypothetical protein
MAPPHILQRWIGLRIYGLCSADGDVVESEDEAKSRIVSIKQRRLLGIDRDTGSSLKHIRGRRLDSTMQRGSNGSGQLHARQMDHRPASGWRRIENQQDEEDTGGLIRSRIDPLLGLIQYHVAGYQSRERRKPDANLVLARLDDADRNHHDEALGPRAFRGTGFSGIGTPRKLLRPVQDIDPHPATGPPQEPPAIFRNPANSLPP